MSLITRIAYPVLVRLKARDAQYERDVEDAARHGFRPHYCKHGTNLWVEYDAMCPGCEEALTPYEEALIIAHEARDETMRRCTVTAALAKEPSLPIQVFRDLMKWESRPITNPTNY